MVEGPGLFDAAPEPFKRDRVKHARTRYVLTVDAEHRDDDPEGVRRLRMALKRMLRGMGLICRRVEPAKEAT